MKKNLFNWGETNNIHYQIEPKITKFWMNNRFKSAIISLKYLLNLMTGHDWKRASRSALFPFFNLCMVSGLCFFAIKPFSAGMSSKFQNWWIITSPLHAIPSSQRKDKNSIFVKIGNLFVVCVTRGPTTGYSYKTLFCSFFVSCIISL